MYADMAIQQMSLTTYTVIPHLEMRACYWSISCHVTYTNIQIVTGVEVTIGNCFPEVGEILPDAEFFLAGQWWANFDDDRTI